MEENMIITRKYNLDILPGGVPLIIRASQKDNSSVLKMSLRSRDGILQIPSSGLTAKMKGKTLGGTSCTSNGTISIVNNIPVVTVSLPRSMTSDIGMNPFELELSGSGVKLVTATFYLDVR